MNIIISVNIIRAGLFNIVFMYVRSCLLDLVWWVLLSPLCLNYFVCLFNAILCFRPIAFPTRQIGICKWHFSAGDGNLIRICGYSCDCIQASEEREKSKLGKGVHICFSSKISLFRRTYVWTFPFSQDKLLTSLVHQYELCCCDGDNNNNSISSSLWHFSFW